MHACADTHTISIKSKLSHMHMHTHTHNHRAEKDIKKRDHIVIEFLWPPYAGYNFPSDLCDVNCKQICFLSNAVSVWEIFESANS